MCIYTLSTGPKLVYFFQFIEIFYALIQQLANIHMNNQDLYFNSLYDRLIQDSLYSTQYL